MDFKFSWVIVSKCWVKAPKRLTDSSLNEPTHTKWADTPTSMPASLVFNTEKGIVLAAFCLIAFIMVNIDLRERKQSRILLKWGTLRKEVDKLKISNHSPSMIVDWAALRSYSVTRLPVSMWERLLRFVYCSNHN